MILWFQMAFHPSEITQIQWHLDACAARRTQRALFRLGRFDPPGASEWHAFGEETLNSSAHQAAVWDAALQGLVLLKNDGGGRPPAPATSAFCLGSGELRLSTTRRAERRLGGCTGG